MRVAQRRRNEAVPEHARERERVQLVQVRHENLVHPRQGRVGVEDPSASRS